MALVIIAIFIGAIVWGINLIIQGQYVAGILLVACGIPIITAFIFDVLVPTFKDWIRG